MPRFTAEHIMRRRDANFLRICILIVSYLCTVTSAWAANEPDWIKESNRQAVPLLDVMAKYVPEQAAVYGVDGHNADVFDAKPDVVHRQEADLDAVASGYRKALTTESDPRVKQDL